MDVLDVGCGHGTTAPALHARGYRVIAFDVSEDGVAIAQRAHPEVEFHVCSAYDDYRKVAPNGVDSVIATETLEPSCTATFLRRSHDVLRPDGTIVLTAPYHGYWKNLALSITGSWDRHLAPGWDGGHIKLFSEGTLADLLIAAAFSDAMFRNSRRFPLLWKSMACRARRAG